MPARQCDAATHLLQKNLWQANNQLLATTYPDIVYIATCNLPKHAPRAVAGHDTHRPEPQGPGRQSVLNLNKQLSYGQGSKKGAIRMLQSPLGSLLRATAQKAHLGQRLGSATEDKSAHVRKR